VFLTEEGNDLAHKFHDENFLQKLAYLSDIFQKLNGLNLQLQGTNTHLPQLTDKITYFTKKLKMWERRLAEGSVDSFENLNAFLDNNELENTIIPCMKAHISALQKHFQKYFPEDSAKYDTRYETPFKQLHLTSDSTRRIQFTSNSMCFGLEWSGLPTTRPRAMGILLPFATSYLCETGFSAVAAIKTKYRSKLNIENELRVAISNQQPRFDKICKIKQAHTSH